MSVENHCPHPDRGVRGHEPQLVFPVATLTQEDATTLPVTVCVCRHCSALYWLPSAEEEAEKD